jgi:WD40 repeat protein
MIYTGGHDGTLISWSMDTGSAKRQLHEKDPTCLAKNKELNQAIKESKSVEALLILELRQVLLSMTADQWLRFWSLDELVTDNQPQFKFHCKHPEDDQLSACAVTKDNNTLVTADTSGQLKIWDITNVDFSDQSTEEHFIEKVFIIAHKALINTI